MRNNTAATANKYPYRRQNIHQTAAIKNNLKPIHHPRTFFRGRFVSG